MFKQAWGRVGSLIAKSCEVVSGREGRLPNVGVGGLELRPLSPGSCHFHLDCRCPLTFSSSQPLPRGPISFGCHSAQRFCSIGGPSSALLVATHIPNGWRHGDCTLMLMCWLWYNLNKMYVIYNNTLTT